jgi:hypothetical protein
MYLSVRETSAVYTSTESLNLALGCIYMYLHGIYMYIHSITRTWMYIQSPAHFCKGDLSKLTALVNFWLGTGTDFIETPGFPV